MKPDSILFMTLVGSPGEKADARLMIDSLRSFGGEMAGCTFWVFASDPRVAPCADLETENTRIFPLEVPAAAKGYLFGDKVAARARAEQLAPAATRSLVWVDPGCLFVGPPLLFDLGPDFEAAVRPVHIRNVGLAPGDPPGEFWKGVYAAVGSDGVRTTVESFVDGQRIRSYFNSHAHAVNPARGLFRRWLELFEGMIADRDFQARACPDETHQIFLFQAIFSALLVASLEPERIRILPPTYNYPLHLQGRIPADRRAAALNDLVCFSYEQESIRPEALTGIQVREPLRSWLVSHLSNRP